MSDERQSKRKAARGRQAPMHTLEESLKHLHQIYQAVGNHASGRDVLGEALGHKATSASAHVKIGALSHFGLVKARGGGAYEITPLALRVLMPRDDEERSRAIAEAARSPTLYRELIGQLSGQQMPKLLGNLLGRNYGVIPKQAESFAERFRETMEFAGLLRTGVLHDEVADSSRDGMTDSEDSEEEELSSSSARAGDVLVTRVPSAGAPTPREVGASTQQRTQEYTIPLGAGGELAVIQIPVPVREGFLKRIESWAAYMRSVLEDDTEAERECDTPSG